MGKTATPWAIAKGSFGVIFYHAMPEFLTKFLRLSSLDISDLRAMILHKILKTSSFSKIKVNNNSI
jgi:hypothetical protein